VFIISSHKGQSLTCSCPDRCSAVFMLTSVIAVLSNVIQSAETQHDDHVSLHQTLTWSVFVSAEDKAASARPNAKDREAFNAKNILQVRNVTKRFPFLINAVLLNSQKSNISQFPQKYCAAQFSTLIIIRNVSYYHDFWRSCDTEDCSNDAENTQK